MTFERARSVMTIPSSDTVFSEHVTRTRARHPDATSAEFERLLRSLFPRVVVRERSLSGETPSWYVYRDGSWRPQQTGPWWQEPGLPRMVSSSDGWLVEVSRTAADLIGITEADGPSHHFTDFAPPGAAEAAEQLLEVLKSGHPLDATVVLRPTSGELIAVDIHATREGDHLVATLRLADDVAVEPRDGPTTERPRTSYAPATDVAFRAYTERALGNMAEPTPTGLELRLRRLYPHAHVDVDGDGWVVNRDRDGQLPDDAKWWLDPTVARVRYDAQALILEATDAARELFGRDLVGHHWQEFVTAGSTDEVALMLDILAEIGAAESRFRLPMPDGALLEFDSYTEVSGDEFTSAYRLYRP